MGYTAQCNDRCAGEPCVHEAREFPETPRDEVEAVDSDGLRYPSWDALVEATANGYVAVAIMTREIENQRLAVGQAPKTETWPWVVGPFATKREANNARNRLRAKWKREKDQHLLTTATFAVRPAWKDTK